MIKKLREMRETNGLDLEQEEVNPTNKKNLKNKFEIPNEYLEIILFTDSDFILSDGTSTICITADLSFNTRLVADFKKDTKMRITCLYRDQEWEAWLHSLPQFHKSPANTYAFG